jgi:hypothetical protein
LLDAAGAAFCVAGGDVDALAGAGEAVEVAALVCGTPAGVGEALAAVEEVKVSVEAAFATAGVSDDVAGWDRAGVVAHPLVAALIGTLLICMRPPSGS